MVTDTTHLLSLFENATEGIIIINNLGKIILINPAAERMFGYQASELVNQKIEILVPGRFRPNHEHLREGFHSNPSNRIMGQNRDLAGLKKDGTVVAVGQTEYGQCNVSAWKDISTISAGWAFSTAFKKDGTVIAVGNNEYHQLDAENLKR